MTIWAMCTRLAMVAVAFAHTHGGVAAEWKPERNVEIIVGSAPGSGQDLTARQIQKIWQDNGFLAVPQIIVNKPGAGGAIGWDYLARHAGDAHYLATVSPPMLANQILGTTRETLADMTPLALLNQTYVTFSVKSDHVLKSIGDLAQRLKKDPSSVTFGFATALGNAMHVTGALYVRALGLDAREMKTVVFNASAAAMTNVMGGHVDVLITTFSTIGPSARAGKLRILGVAAPSRQTGTFANVPTFRESGFDVVVSNWLGVVGAKGLTPSQIAYWDGLLAKTTSSPDWQRAMADVQQEATYLPSREMKKFLERERENYRAVLTELRLAK